MRICLSTSLTMRYGMVPRATWCQMLWILIPCNSNVSSYTCLHIHTRYLHTIYTRYNLHTIYTRYIYSVPTAHSPCWPRSPVQLCCVECWAVVEAGLDTSGWSHDTCWHHPRPGHYTLYTRRGSSWLRDMHIVHCIYQYFCIFIANILWPVLQKIKFLKIFIHLHIRY